MLKLLKQKIRNLKCDNLLYLEMLYVAKIWTRCQRLCESYVDSRVNLPKLNFSERETLNESREVRLLIENES